ncbi:hypothetical protein PV326_005982 [Microctonus aethiopoides]|nr:hypothetical protein PV326_005982 [Microctonus aethiopoides]
MEATISSPTNRRIFLIHLKNSAKIFSTTTRLRYRPIHSSHYTTIEIEIPKSNDYIGKWKSQNPWTTHRTFHDYIPELIAEDDNELIKGNNQKLRIHISRSDNLDNDQGSVISVSSDITHASASERGVATVDYTKPEQFISLNNFEGG